MLSSAGWKISRTRPGSSPLLGELGQRPGRAPSSTVVCTSWPQAWQTPSTVDRYGTSLVSGSGSASRSARSATTRSPCADVADHAVALGQQPRRQAGHGAARGRSARRSRTRGRTARGGRGGAGGSRRAPRRGRRASGRAGRAGARRRAAARATLRGGLVGQRQRTRHVGFSISVMDSVGRRSSDSLASRGDAAQPHFGDVGCERHVCPCGAHRSQAESSGIAPASRRTPFDNVRPLTEDHACRGVPDPRRRPSHY